jgi:hypothetical protein
MNGIDSLHRSTGDEQQQREARATQLVRRAWWSLALFPVSFVAASLLGGILLAAMGHDPDSETTPPWGPTLAAGVPAMMVMILPALAAAWFGRRAQELGQPNGRAATVTGLALAGALVMLNVAAAVFSR